MRKIFGCLQFLNGNIYRLVRLGKPNGQAYIRLRNMKRKLHPTISLGKESRRKYKKEQLSVFYKFATFHKNPVFNQLLNERLRRLVNIATIESNENCVGLDIGCGSGYLSRYLSYKTNGTVIGIDLSKTALYRGKFLINWGVLENVKTEFVLADINHLPFKNNSFGLVFCASVFEHLKDLDEALRKIGDSMTNRGSLVAGYPIENRLFIVLIKLFSPDWMKIRDPSIMGQENFERDPDTHKQSFVSIRKLLQKRFIITNREKSFFTFLPDAFSWYECAKVKKRK